MSFFSFFVLFLHTRRNSFTFWRNWVLVAGSVMSALVWIFIFTIVMWSFGSKQTSIHTITNQGDTCSTFEYIREINIFCVVVNCHLHGKWKHMRPHRCCHSIGVDHFQSHSTDHHSYLALRCASFWISCCCYQTISKPVGTDQSIRQHLVVLFYWHCRCLQSSQSLASL